MLQNISGSNATITTIKECEWVTVPHKQPMILYVHFAPVPPSTQLSVWVNLRHCLLDYLMQGDGEPYGQLANIALVVVIKA
jgi:hypothetical protein